MRQVNSCNEVIGLGSFYKRRPYDYIDDELNLPQGHEDHICTVDLLPVNRKHPDEDDDSVHPTDWLECLYRSFGPGTWKRLRIGDLMTQYGCFYTGATREFSNIHGGKEWEHHMETKEKIKDLQVANVRHNLSPNVGGEQFKKERAEEFQAHENAFMARFRAKSSHWTAYQNE